MQSDTIHTNGLPNHIKHLQTVFKLSLPRAKTEFNYSETRRLRHLHKTTIIYLYKKLTSCLTQLGHADRILKGFNKFHVFVHSFSFWSSSG